MIHQQAIKHDNCLLPTAITNGATATSLQVDTIGFDAVEISVFATTSNATTRPVTLRLTESDDTVLTNYVGITQFTGTSNTVTSTSAGFVIALAKTATSRLPIAVLNVNCLARKRYLTLEYSGTTTQTISAVARLSRGEINPTDLVSANCDVIVNG